MLASFPRLYEKELLYSWFARYHLQSCNLSPKMTMKNLFGMKNTIAVPDLPTNINKVYERLEHFDIPNVEVLINNHTFFKYFTTFIDTEIKKQVLEAIKNGNKPGAIHMKLGIMASSIKESSYFRYCPECLKEDFIKYGETYWRLYHQLPSVFVCLEHNVLLRDSNVVFRSHNKHSYFPATKENCIFTDVEPIYSEKTVSFLKVLAVESVKLLQNNYNFNKQELQNAYRYLLQKNGFLSAKGKVDQKFLSEQFNAYFGNQLLELLQSKVNQNNDSCWLKSITRKHRKNFHPIRHLLFISFLNENLDTIYNFSNEKYYPFGKGPYLCLNVAANHYLKPTIQSVNITRDSKTKQFVGTFDCSCGFIYSRRGPDKEENDIYKIGRVKQYGVVWLDKLNYLINKEKLSYSVVSKILKADIQTVKKYIHQDKKLLRSEDKKKSEILLLKQQRDKWVELRLHNKTLSKTDLRVKCPSLYMWLYRNDNKWLNKNSPNKRTKKNNYSRINWMDRDECILSDVKKAVSILLLSGEPIHINLNRIGKMIRQLGILQKHLEKIPRTKNYLESVIETTEQFQIRRIHWVAKELNKKNEDLIEWKIKKLAGLRGVVASQVQCVINKVIKNYSKRNT